MEYCLGRINRKNGKTEDVWFQIGGMRMGKQEIEALGYALTSLYGNCDDCESFCVERDSEQCLRCPFNKAIEVITGMRREALKEGKFT